MYTFFKIAASLAIKLYCKKTEAHFQGNRVANVPTIIASNHPNSFFDAILIAIHYPEPIYFLARGDAFTNPIVAKLLHALHLIPIYRLSEGKENLNKNDDTFKTCLTLLQKNKTILIFSEGICINEWNLRPLKKGAARLALMALQDGLSNLQIQPTNINYSSFFHNPKEVEINFNTAFTLNTITTSKDAVFYNTFNSLLKKNMLKNMLIKPDKNDIDLFNKPSKDYLNVLKTVIALPAFVGFATNYGIYFLIQKIAIQKTQNTVFYDSILFGLLLLIYPVFVLAMSIIVAFMCNILLGILVFFTMPLSAWCYKMYKSY